MSDVTEATAEIDEDPRRGAPPEIVGPYLAQVLGDAAWSTCEVALVSGGKSNLTYVVSSPAGEVVLRRPPLAAVLPTAHDMVREHRVISALAGHRCAGAEGVPPLHGHLGGGRSVLRDGAHQRAHRPRHRAGRLRRLPR